MNNGLIHALLKGDRENRIVDDDSTVNIEELEFCLVKCREELDRKIKKDRLKLARENKGTFNEYIKRHNELERIWKPLEREFARVKLFGDPEMSDIQRTVMEIKGVRETMNSINDEESYLNFLVDFLLKKSIEISSLPDYEKVRFERDGLSATIISQKSSLFLKEIELVLEGCRSLSISNRVESQIPEIALKYMGNFKDQFSNQLQQLPHLAALFYNDSLMFCDYFRQKFNLSLDSKNIIEIEYIGKDVWSDILERNKLDLLLLCGPELWQLNYGCLDDSSMQTLQKSLKKGILRLNQISKIYSSILNNEALSTVMSELIIILLKWVWNGLLSLERVGKDVLIPFTEFLETSRQISQDLIPELPDNCRLYCDKIETLQRITKMDLIRVSIAIQREEFNKSLTAEELLSVVGFLYPDSTTKSALLEEIQAELN